LPLITQSADKTKYRGNIKTRPTNQAGNKVKPGRTPKKNVRRAGPFFFNESQQQTQKETASGMRA